MLGVALDMGRSLANNDVKEPTIVIIREIATAESVGGLAHSPRPTPTYVRNLGGVICHFSFGRILPVVLYDRMHTVHAYCILSHYFEYWSTVS